jgi:Lipase (class 3)
MRILRLFPLLTSLCTAAQVPLGATEDEAQNRTISQALFAELEELSRIVDIAYCVGIQGPGIQKPFECPSRCANFEHFELVTTWNTGQLLSDSCGYVALSHAPSSPRLIVAFRGTYSITNTIADLSTIPQEYEPYPGDDGESGHDVPKCENCTVHMGFLQSWKNTRNVILPDIIGAIQKHPDYQMTLVGHSLGGAVAILAGLELLARGLSPVLTTFGEPRLGNQAFVDYLGARFNISDNSTDEHALERSRLRRVTHIDDPVPFLPLEEWGYMSHSGEIFISKADLPPEREHVRYCVGQKDPECITGTASGWSRFPWGIPTRLKIWQLFFAHRDYFWRLGLCLPQTKWLWNSEVTQEL